MTDQIRLDNETYDPWRGGPPEGEHPLHQKLREIGESHGIPEDSFDPFGSVEADREALLALKVRSVGHTFRDPSDCNALARPRIVTVPMATEKPSDEYPRAIEELSALGYFAVRVEAYHSVAGMFVTRDLYGIADIQGVKFGQSDERPGMVGEPTRSVSLILLQMTTLRGVGPHIQKMASRDPYKLPGGGTMPQVEITLKLLEAGARIEVWGWYGDQTKHWQHTVTTITRQVIEAAIGRQRGPR